VIQKKGRRYKNYHINMNIILLSLGLLLCLINGVVSTTSENTGLDRSQAYAQVAKIMWIKPFIEDWVDFEQTDAIQICTNRSALFQSSCSGFNSDEDCRDKKNNVCCNDGKLECKRDTNGEEYTGVGLEGLQCCDECLTGPCDQKPSEDIRAMEASKREGRDGFVTVYASIGGGCGKCIGRGLDQELFGDDRDGLTRCAEGPNHLHVVNQQRRNRLLSQTAQTTQTHHSYLTFSTPDSLAF
jgi:hypothetical protein